MRRKRGYLVGLTACALVLVAATSASAAPGTTTNLSYSPTRINYGREAVGGTKAGYVSVTNTSTGDLYFIGAGVGPYPTYQINLGGGSTCFGLTSNDLPAGQTCQFEVDFTPPAKRGYAGSMGSSWAPSPSGPITDRTNTSLTGVGF